MSIPSIIEALLIGPLEVFFEIVFVTAYRIIGHPGSAIIFLSLAMNILILPLYRRADTLQEEARDKEAQLHNGVTHIKKVFSGDERMMVLRTYYRQNNYKPTDALNGSVSLLLEIPFFMAAYQFLSHLEILNGISLGPIADLGAPDRLLTIGGVTLNLLPLLMTLINVISSSLYLKGFSLKNKIQVYGIAAIFLIFLYKSPSGLVFYWTLNNVFSLVKNICYKIPKSEQISRLPKNTKDSARLSADGKQKSAPEFKLFLSSTLFLTILIGVLIPSIYIAASPQEYIYYNHYYNPMWYIVKCLCTAAGIFLIWMGVFYHLAGSKGKIVFDRFLWILCGAALGNYMLFGTKLGVISSTLQYDSDMFFPLWQKLVNLLFLVIVSIIFYFFISKFKHAAINILIISTITISIMSVVNFITIRPYIYSYPVQRHLLDEPPNFQLSTSGQNVVVIMLDRAMGEYIPYLFQEKPELEEQFSGFTYYENTLSYAGSTDLGSPALLGGYEYTPVEMNRRAQESLVSKHNETLLVMPTIFSENGYQVTVFDPVYANYQWYSDISIYDDYPDISAYVTEGWFGDDEGISAIIDKNSHNFLYFSMMKTMPVFLQPMIYNHGLYLGITPASAADAASVSYSDQIIESIYTASGMDINFMNAYWVLANLPTMTNIITEDTNTYLLMVNNATHEPMLLQEPDYTPAPYVDNTAYAEEYANRYTIGERKLIMDTVEQVSHYHANMAVIMQLGNWFDYLRENNVYDNTRIILVSDHGRNLAHIEELVFDDGNWDIEAYYPLLMVKDFNSGEFVTSDEFMTNADVPTLAMEGIILNPVNPFTGTPINNNEKYAHDQFIALMNRDGLNPDNGSNTFRSSAWASVHDNIWDRNNWTFYDVETVLDEHAAP